jgi:multidrug resistance efflux pump
MNQRRVIAILLGLLAVVAGAGAVYLWRGRTPAPKTEATTATTPVVEQVSVPAVLHAATVTQVPVPIDGKVESFEVEAGAEVFEGQLLARIRSQTLEGVREAAELDLERAETRARTLETALTAARLEASRAAADAARARNELERATKVYQRQKMMIEQGATPRKVFEKAEAEFKTAEQESRNLDVLSQASDERISSLSRELDTARKILESKSEDLEAAKERIGFGDVLSPVTGIVVSRRGQAGDDVTTATTDLFEIASDLSSMQAVADVDPSFAKSVQPGLAVAILIAELGGEPLDATVSKVEGGTITANFANPDPVVKPGLTAQMRITLP